MFEGGAVESALQSAGLVWRGISWKGELHPKTTSLPRCGVDSASTSQALAAATDDGQSDAGAWKGFYAVQAFKDFKDSFAAIRRHADAIVFYFDAHEPILQRSELNVHFWAYVRRHELDGVL